MAAQSQNFFLSVSTQNHVSGMVQASVSRHPDTPNHPIVRLRPMQTTASSLAGRPILNAIVKPQRKRPHHDPDSESDGDDTDFGSLGPASPSPKRPRRVDSAMPSSNDDMNAWPSGSEDELPSEAKTEPFPTFESLPDPYATLDDVADLEVVGRGPRNAAGDLLLRSGAALEGGFSEAQVKWATVIVDSLLMAAKERLFKLVNEYEGLRLGRIIDFDEVKVGKWEPGDDPVLLHTAAMGCWMFREDTSPMAEDEECEELTTALVQLEHCMARVKGLEMMCQ